MKICSLPTELIFLLFFFNEISTFLQTRLITLGPLQNGSTDVNLITKYHFLSKTSLEQL